ncbi:MAG: permease prefix domain 1-containing protein, partial [Gemmatimonadaceae bacterium]
MHPALSALRRRLRQFVRRDDFERQLDDELRAHVDAEAADLVRRGVNPSDAHRRAVAALGGYERWRDEARDTRLASSLESGARDARLAARGLVRSP